MLITIVVLIALTIANKWYIDNGVEQTEETYGR